jgi:hypothetical protein
MPKAHKAGLHWATPLPCAPGYRAATLKDQALATSYNFFVYFQQ